MRARNSLLGLCAAVMASMIPALPSGATAAAQVERLAGGDRIETAVAISQHGWRPDAAGGVVLARADAFPDALAGGPLAVAKRGPLLLTASTSLDARTGAEIDRVLAAGQTVHLLGGDAAVSPGVAAELQRRGYRTVRYGGTDRFETAVMIARDGLGTSVRSVLLADGLTFPDALIAGAAAPVVDGAVILTAGSAVPPASSAYLAGVGAGTPRYAIGSRAAQAAPAAVRLAGADAYETSTVVAARLHSDVRSVAVASGTAFPDGLAGGPHIATRPGPILLTASGQLPAVVDRYLRANAATITTGFVYGGSNAVADTVLAHVQHAIHDSSQSASSGAKSVLRESAANFDGHLVRWEKPVITVALVGSWTTGTLADAVGFWNEILTGLGVELRAASAPADMVFEMRSTPNPGAPAGSCGQEGPTAYDGFTITAAGGQLWPTYGSCGTGRAGNEATWDRVAIRHSIGHSLGLLSHTPSGTDVMSSPNAAAGDSPLLREVFQYLYSVPPGTAARA